MISFKGYITELAAHDLSSKYRGKSTGELMKMARDNRKYSPAERENIKRELQMRAKLREDTGGTAIAGAPGNNTRSGPGMGDDNSLKLGRARMYKKIYRRFNTTREEARGNSR